MKHYEESDYFNIRKDAKKERKRASRLDRSKYKKTDQPKKTQDFPPLEPTGSLQRGIVTTIRPQQFTIQWQGEEYVCSLKGSLKNERSRVKNLVIVGDLVHFDPENKVLV